MLPGATYVDPELSWKYESGPAGATFHEGAADFASISGDDSGGGFQDPKPLTALEDIRRETDSGVGLIWTCARGLRSAPDTANPPRALASGLPRGPCSTAGCSAGGLCERGFRVARIASRLALPTALRRNRDEFPTVKTRTRRFRAGAYHAPRCRPPRRRRHAPPPTDTSSRTRLDAGRVTAPGPCRPAAADAAGRRTGRI